jgi:hypothetical protein
VVASYFDLIDEIAAELESRYMSGNGKMWIMQKCTIGLRTLSSSLSL